MILKLKDCNSGESTRDEHWRIRRPTSSTSDPETSMAENEIDRLLRRYQGLQKSLKACRKKSRKQEKVINQVKLENEILNDEKQKELQESEKRSTKLEIEKQRLEKENQNFENDLKEKEEKIQSDERENQKYKTNLQQKIKATEMFYEALIIKLKNDKRTYCKFFTLTLVGIAIGIWQVKHGHAKELQSCEIQYNTFRDCE